MCSLIKRACVATITSGVDGDASPSQHHHQPHGGDPLRKSRCWTRQNFVCLAQLCWLPPIPVTVFLTVLSTGNKCLSKVIRAVFNDERLGVTL